jgi:hypothetical protein
MNAIAWDGQTLSADLLLSSTIRGEVTRIRRVNHNGHLIGVSGKASTSVEVMRWYEAGEVAVLLSRDCGNGIASLELL